MKNIIILFGLLLIATCRGQHITNSEPYYDTKKFISIDTDFVRNLKSKIIIAQKAALNKETQRFIDLKIQDNQYKDLLDALVLMDELFVPGINESMWGEIIAKKKNSNKVDEIYIISIQLSGDEIINSNAVIIKNFDGNTEIYASGMKPKSVFSDDILLFTEEFMLNLPYSFDNKTPNLSGHFSISKITSSGANEYQVTSAMANEMLDYQYEILKKFYFSK
ncbi:hypothetical protein [Flavobacterium pallidum]|uniref:DUF4468 domain-containing protein n=1 Tax=Flavobacterium pallidum TaxID=2172098 RepID=A0A2S1SGN0_9FLAO|nr:hypothetical protein [Flavobacterium pallidum]AWI25560.1 hypothetical protein HYN49_06440 [Flavobacterium pallidum]